MDPGTLRLLFLAAFAAGLLIEIGLDLLNRREIARNPVLPGRFARPPFAGRFTPEAYARSRAYALERMAFGGVARLWSAVLTLALLFSGILPWWDRLLERVCGDGLSRGALFLAGLAAVPALLQLPFSAWSAFRIEGKYGFNTLTWGLFWRDAARGLLLAAALGLPVLYALMAFFRYAGGHWWLGAMAAALGYQAILMVLYPAFIAPLFNRFTPLEEGDLKRLLLELAARLRFPAAGIFVMDGSRRSLHSNAYFTGFGRFRRIVLFDTLLRQMEPKEIASVLAHEIGHYKLKHIAKLMAAQAFMLGAILFLAALALRWPALYQAFGFAAGPAAGAFAGPPAPGLYLFFALFSVLGPLFAPFGNALSRRHEYEADAFAVRTTGDASSMQSALIKLSEGNLSNLTPHPWYSAYHYSHPTVTERVEAIGMPRSPQSA
jgi:STE24 endopeptidase